MAVEEKISKHLGQPYIYLKDRKKFLCSNGVLFILEEFKNGIDLNAEYERRAREDMLYDYAYAKNTGLLRKKRGYAKKQEILSQDVEEVQKEQEDTEEARSNDEDNDRRTADNLEEPLGRSNPVLEETPTVMVEKGREANKRDCIGEWRENITDKPEKAERKNRSIFLIILILAFASVCSMYESTLHTATYLFDYVDMISAWLLSTAVTAYNSSAFEVSVMFHNMKRNFMAFIFMLLWAMVTLFSMATTVSVFYDRFNFNETQIAQENKTIDSNKLGLELLRTKEKDLREAIEFKKKDIEYRQEHEYATTAVRLELENLQKELQENLTEQQKLLEETPEVMEEKLQRKESLFAFLGRLIGLEGGILEFIMSTLSAIFINLIAPLSLTAVIELNKRKGIDK
jgi:hypothetical protein